MSGTSPRWTSRRLEGGNCAQDARLQSSEEVEEEEKEEKEAWFQLTTTIFLSLAK